MLSLVSFFDIFLMLPKDDFRRFAQGGEEEPHALSDFAGSDLQICVMGDEPLFVAGAVDIVDVAGSFQRSYGKV
jgi:hypothetical protein